ncbi:MAG: NADH-quinone oxidoreductase subunit J [Acidobacteria bacterium]|nr:NADH-quinone oxidoreductase subunit J [Acidobacteriota bacterium]
MGILFYVFAVIAVAGGLAVILQRRPIYSELALIVVMVSLAVIYLLLGAEFMAAIQVLVYAGAIMVVFVFVIMLLNAGKEAPTKKSVFARYLSLPVPAAFLGFVIYAVVTEYPRDSLAVGGRLDGSVHNVARLLFRDYVLPFEVTSLLILIAILGAVVLAQKEEGGGVTRR